MIENLSQQYSAFFTASICEKMHPGYALLLASRDRLMQEGIATQLRHQQAIEPSIIEIEQLPT